MQGDNAAESIINSLLTIHNQGPKFDLVVIIRGGGSQIDLDCFDNYELAAHIAQFPFPVLTGIGHERDETIADLVAHTRLKTPTAVAEFLIGGLLAFEDRLDLGFSRLYHLTKGVVKNQEQSLLIKEQNLKAILTGTIHSEENRINSYGKDLKSLVQQRFINEKYKIEIKEKALKLLDPENAFRRGYTLTTLGGKPIKQESPEIGDQIVTHAARLRLTSSITDIEKKND